MATAEKTTIDVEKIRATPIERRAAELFKMIAPSLGWVVPKSQISFRRSEGIGKSAKFLVPTRSDPFYIEVKKNGSTVTHRAGKAKSKLVQVAIPPVPPQIPGLLKLRLNGEIIEIAHGNAGEMFTDRLTGKTQRSVQPKPIMPSNPGGFQNSRPSSIDVNPRLDFDKYAYIMLHPRCSLSPLHMDFDTKARLGITIDWEDPSFKTAALLTPDNIDATQDRMDEIANEDVALIAKLHSTGAMELLKVCQDALISVKGNPESPEKHYRARLLEIIQNKARPGFKEKYEKIKLLIVGAIDIKDFEKTIKAAVKLGLLAHDGTIWTTKWDRAKLPWTVMDDPTSGSIAEKGEEAGWLARKIVTDDMETWFEDLSRRVDEAEAEKYEEIMGRGDGTHHEILERAVVGGVIVAANKQRVIRWAIDGTDICDIKGWGNDNHIKNLKEHFKEMEVEDLAALVVSKTVVKG